MRLVKASAARCIFYLTVAVLILGGTRHTWLPYFQNESVAAGFSAEDRIYVVLRDESGASLAHVRLHTQLRSASELGTNEASAQASFWVDVSVDTVADKVSSDNYLYVVATGRAGSVLRHCVGHQSAVRPVDRLTRSDLTSDATSAWDDWHLDSIVQRATRILRVERDASIYHQPNLIGFTYGVRCVSDTTDLWTGQDEYHYLGTPDITVLAQRNRGGDRGRSGEITDHCIEVMLTSGRGAIVEDFWPAEATVGTTLPYRADGFDLMVNNYQGPQYAWLDCYADRRLSLLPPLRLMLELDAEQVDVAILDTRERSLVSRDLFAGGLALGLVGALLLEGAGLLLPVGGTLATRMGRRVATFLRRLRMRIRSGPHESDRDRQLTLF